VAGKGQAKGGKRNKKEKDIRAPAHSSQKRTSKGEAVKGWRENGIKNKERYL